MLTSSSPVKLVTLINRVRRHLLDREILDSWCLRLVFAICHNQDIRKTATVRTAPIGIERISNLDYHQARLPSCSLSSSYPSSAGWLELKDMDNKTQSEYVHEWRRQGLRLVHRTHFRLGIRSIFASGFYANNASNYLNLLYYRLFARYFHAREMGPQGLRSMLYWDQIRVKDWYHSYGHERNSPFQIVP